MLTAGEVILRSLVIYVAMLTLARIMGKREMARMSYFDWVVGITIGSLAAATVFDPAFPVRLGLLALAVWGGMEVLVSLGALKYRGFRKLLEGGPTPVTAACSPGTWAGCGSTSPNWPACCGSGR